MPIPRLRAPYPLLRAIFSQTPSDTIPNVEARRILRTSRKTWFAVFAIGALLATSAGLLGLNELMGRLSLGFFGLVTAVALVQLVRPSKLALDEEGFTIGRVDDPRHRIRWT